MKNKYESSHKEQLKMLEDKLMEETEIMNSLKSFNQGSSSTSPTSTSPGRTMASPEWGTDDGPINLNKRWNITGIPLVDFESGHEFLGFQKTECPIFDIFFQFSNY